MTKFFPTVLIALAPILAACGGGEILRYPVPAIEPEERINVGFRTIEVREVALPRYAEEEEIFQRIEGGALTSTSTTLWADDPARSVTLALSRHLGSLSSATVASEPWPFEERPSVRVEVRVEDMLADSDGRFRMTGQYFVAPTDGRRGRDGRFDLSAPIAPDSGIAGTANARAAVVLDLARQIARDGLR